MLKDLSFELHSLTVFRGLLSDCVIKNLLAFLDTADEGDERKSLDFYAEFVKSLYESGFDSLSSYIAELTSSDENVYIRYKTKDASLPSVIKESTERELKILQKVCDLTSEKLTGFISYNGLLPSFKEEKLNISEFYADRMENIHKFGYGMYAKYRMFYLSEGKIVPVVNPDRTNLSELIDYKREQKIILDNTNALLSGKPASNILLTGDAGTGKSSTIKAIVNELYSRGLRILEVRKEQLRELPKILDELTDNPLKFIVFIDDLSFPKDDDNFSALKAILEGSVSAKGQNVVIYATSNRRHLVKETFSDREGDDIHRNDTMQEIISLSERFGIQVTFSRPDKKTYLDIVHHLADAAGIEYDEGKIDLAAERFVLSRGSRSARAARQFIDNIISGNIIL
jgi:predicted AAA+ superfamily ATPase